MREIFDPFGRPYNKELHDILRAINWHHMEANPIMPSEAELAAHRAARDMLIAELKKQDKRVILVKADYLENCGRYVCEGDDGFNGYDPLPGSNDIEQEV